MAVEYPFRLSAERRCKQRPSSQKAAESTKRSRTILLPEPASLKNLQRFVSDAGWLVENRFVQHPGFAGADDRFEVDQKNPSIRSV
jgi:hypothetical protein